MGTPSSSTRNAGWTRSSQESRSCGTEFEWGVRKKFSPRTVLSHIGSLVRFYSLPVLTLPHHHSVRNIVRNKSRALGVGVMLSSTLQTFRPAHPKKVLPREGNFIVRRVSEFLLRAHLGCKRLPKISRAAGVSITGMYGC